MKGTVGLLCVTWAKLKNPKNLIVIGVDRGNEDKAKIAGATHCIILLLFSFFLLLFFFSFLFLSYLLPASFPFFLFSSLPFPPHFFYFIKDITVNENPLEFVKSLTEGRGADVVVEV